MADEKIRERRRKMVANAKMQRLREGVSGPDTVISVQTWMEIMGSKPKEGISRIYATEFNASGGGNYISFVYKNRKALLDAFAGTHWDCALGVFSERFDDDHSRKKGIPAWAPYWPFQPGIDSKKGGVLSSRPFVYDGYYFYLDQSKKCFFLSAAMSHEQLSAYIDGKLQRNQQG